MSDELKYIFVIMHPEGNGDGYFPFCYETSEEAANKCCDELNNICNKPSDFPVIIKKVPLYSPPWDKITGDGKP